MLLLLPPSETKRADATGAPLDTDLLGYPELNRVRRRTVAAVVKLGTTPRTAMRVLELGPTQTDEIRRNAELRTAPTAPAVELYTGVLYDALDVPTLTAAARRRAGERVAIGSALFGLLRADDPVPPYRFSGGTKVPALGSLVRLWKPALGPVLAEARVRGIVVDLRSGSYRALAPAPDAVDVRVLTERADGSRAVVSHFNKATKGLVARLLVQARSDPASVTDVADVLAAGGLRVERPGPNSIDIVTTG